MDITFTVKHQNIYMAEPPASVVCQAKKYHYAEFDFSTDWAGFTKIATFTNGEITKFMTLDSSDKCVIPWEVLADSGVLQISVKGTKADVVITTEIIELRILSTGIANESTLPSPTSDTLINHESRIKALETSRITEARCQELIDDAIGDALEEDY